MLWCAPAVSAQATPDTLQRAHTAEPRHGHRARFRRDGLVRRESVRQPAADAGRLNATQAVAGTANGMTTYPTPTHIGTGCCADQPAASPSTPRTTASGSCRATGSSAGRTRRPSAWNEQRNVVEVPEHRADRWRHVPPRSRGHRDRPGRTRLVHREPLEQRPPLPRWPDRVDRRVLGREQVENIALQDGATTLSPTRYDSLPMGITTDSAGVLVRRVQSRQPRLPDCARCRVRL